MGRVKALPQKKRKLYEQCDLISAVHDVKTKKLKSKQASSKYGVPLRTIQRHVAGHVLNFARPGIPRMLNDEEELAVVDYAVYMCRRNLPLKRSDLRVTIVDLIRRSGEERVLKCKFNLTIGPGDEWFTKFEDRHPQLKWAVPQTIDPHRDAQSSEYVVDHFFTTYERVLKQLDLFDKPAQVFNCDETYIDGTVASRQKHYGVKGEKLYQRKNTNIDHVTALMAVNANGKVLPTFLIFSKCMPLLSVKDEMPKTWLYAANESGYVTKKLFVEWFKKIFIPNCGDKRPVLLVLDNHESHESSEVLDLARDNQIEILGLPGHSTHLFQPLDVGVFQHVKRKFKEICLLAGLKTIKFCVTRSSVAITWQTAVQQGATPTIVKSSFLRSGLMPFDPTAIDMSRVKSQKVASETDPGEGTSTALTKRNSAQEIKAINADLGAIPPSTIACGECKRPLHPVESVRRLPPALEESFPLPSNGRPCGCTGNSTGPAEKKRRVGVPLERVLTGDEMVKIIKEKETRIKTEKEKKEIRKKGREEKKVKKDEAIQERKKNLCVLCGFKFPPSKGKGKGKGKSNDIDWVACDICDGWMHCACIGLNVEDIPDEYICVACNE